MAQTQRSRTVKTTVTLFRIVEELYKQGGATLTELDDQLDLAKSTIYEHLFTLEELGYVVQDEDGYRMTLRFLDYGIHVKKQRHLSSVVTSHLQYLADETEEIAWLVVEEQGWSYILEVAEGKKAVHTLERIGRRTHLHVNAAGKTILAQLPDDQVDQIIEEHGLPAATPESITDRETLNHELQEIRNRGYGFMDSEAILGLRGVAAPIIVRRKVRGAVGVAGPAKRFTGDWFREELPEKVQATANSIELEATYA